MTGVPAPLKGSYGERPEHDYSGSAFEPLYVTGVEVSGGSSSSADYLRVKVTGTTTPTVLDISAFARQTIR
ncbi:hypothetical protein [Streptosporangium saharense]|uniref:hypothetical protein n=1 Tax=Streptosporangium saharense TaxID=1706840 RepID=UPI003321EF9D